MIRDLAHAAADLLDALDECTLRDWLAVFGQFAGVCIIVASIALICIGFAPEVRP